MKKHFILFPIVTIALSFLMMSCGPSLQERRDDIESAMKSWIGKSETQLVAKWGPPSNTYKLPDGARELTYIYRHTSSSGGYAWQDYWGNVHWSRPTRYQTRTERGFTVDNTGTVIAYRWDGF